MNGSEMVDGDDINPVSDEISSLFDVESIRDERYR